MTNIEKPLVEGKMYRSGAEMRHKAILLPRCRTFLPCFRHSIRWDLIVCLIMAFCFHLNALGEVSTDGSMGAEKKITGPDYRIDADLGRQEGANLFHSFRVFDILTGERAEFYGPESIRNIISRVTGGAASRIDGTLSSKISGAGMYLINPWGILFGPNASLEIDGSFHVSTADYIRLGDDGTFNARSVQQSSLSSSPPSAFGFLTDSPETIDLDGTQMFVPEKQMLSLIAGDIHIKSGSVGTESGQIHIVSAGSEGEYHLAGAQTDGFSKMGDIRLSGDAYLYASGKDGGGNIYIRGNNFVIDNGHVWAETLADGDGGEIDIDVQKNVQLSSSASISGATGGSGRGSDVKVNAETVTVQSGAVIQSASFGDGNSGDLFINADKLHIDDGAVIQATANAAGDGGGVMIQSQQVSVSGGALISVNTFGTGKGGQIDINAAVSMAVTGSNDDNAGGVYANSLKQNGTGGRITIKTPDLTVRNNGIIQAGISADGQAGSIDLDVNSLTIESGAQISTESYGTGRAGDMTIKASKSVVISGWNANRYSSLNASTSSAGGQGGTIFLSAGDLILDQGGMIVADSEGSGNAGQITVHVERLELSNGGRIRSNAHAKGSGGIIEINASDSVKVHGGTAQVGSAILANTFSDGNGGSIRVNAPRLAIFDSGFIESDTGGSGDAGRIRMDVGTLEIATGGILSTDTYQGGNGGSIDISSSDTILITGDPGSPITGINANAYGNGGQGGSININGNRIELEKEGVVTAYAEGQSNGGKIVISVNAMTLRDGGKIFSDTTGDGAGGDISISVSETAAFTGGVGYDFTGLSANTQKGLGKSGRIAFSGRDLILDNGAMIAAGTFASGNAGEIRIDVESLKLDNGSTIEASTLADGRGGNIAATAAQSITVDNMSSINSMSRGGTGQGGNISLTSAQVSVGNSSLIQTGTKGDGDAGNLTINANALTLSGGGTISSNTTAGGSGGIIDIIAEQRIDISGSGIVNDSGIYANTLGNTGRDGTGGSIHIRAPLVDIRDSGRIEAATTGSGNAGGLHLQVNTLNLSGMSQIQAGTWGSGKGGNMEIEVTGKMVLAGSGQEEDCGLYAGAYSGGGDGGNIVLSASELIMDNESRVQALTRGDGNAGNIRLTVGALDISSGAQVAAYTQGAGQGGNIDIIASKTVHITDVGPYFFSGVIVGSQGIGAGGTITVTAPELILENQGRILAPAENAGDSGNIRLNLDRLHMSGGAQIVGSTWQDGNAGLIDINASQSVSITGAAAVLSNCRGGTGNAGGVSITSPEVTIEKDGLIQSGTEGIGNSGKIVINTHRLDISQGARISTDTYAAGRGGDITITAENFVSIAGESQFYPSGLYANSLENGGDGGSIIVNTPGLSVDQGGVIVSESSGASRAGAIHVTADTIDLVNGGRIAANAKGSGDGGNIRVTAGDRLNISGTINGTQSGLLANSLGGGGHGGNILISAPHLTMSNSGTIEAAAAVDGDAGDISIESSQMQLSQSAYISTTTYGQGTGGNIHVTAETIDMETGGNISANTSGTGAGGSIRIENAARFNISGKEGNSSSGLFANTIRGGGKGGNIIVSVRDLTVSGDGAIEAATAGDGNAGDIKIESEQLELCDGGYISTTTYAAGTGGNIQVTAGQSARIYGENENKYSGIYANTGSGTGRGGSITFNCPDIDLFSNAIITAASEGGQGDAGEIRMTSSRISVHEGAQIKANTTGGGRGGSITVVASELAVYNEGDLTAITTGSGDAGRIELEVDILDLYNGGRVTSDTLASGNGGNLTVNAAKRIHIHDGKPDSFTGLSVSTHQGTGKAGSIRVSAPDVTVENEGWIMGVSNGEGDAGDIRLNVGTMTVKNGGKIFSDALGKGKGGNLELNADTGVSILGTREASTGFSAGTYEGGAPGGSIHVSAPALIIRDLGYITAFSGGAGNAGQIRIDVNQLELNNGAKISSDTIAGGQGGDIAIRATRSVSILNSAQDDFTGVSANTLATGKGGSISVDTSELIMNNRGLILAASLESGDAGKIDISADHITLLGSSLISTETRGSGQGGNIRVSFTDAMYIDGKTGKRPSGLYSTTEGTGNAGRILLQGNRLYLSNQAQISTASSSTGFGGNIRLEKVGSLFIHSDASISSKSTGTGEAGQIYIHAEDRIYMENGAITTEAADADGGNIVANAGLLLHLKNSEITATVGGGLGNGGNIRIDPTFIVLENSKIIANAYEGNGGNISLVADYFFSTPDSRVQASSELGIDGTIEIDTPETDISGSITVLPESFLDATLLLQDTCAMRSRVLQSSLVVTGKGGMPQSPDDVLAGEPLRP